MRHPSCYRSLINESQARAILDAISQSGHAAAGAAIGAASGDLINREQPILFDQASNSYVANFRGLALKKVKRNQAKTKKKAEVAVTLASPPHPTPTLTPTHFLQYDISEGTVCDSLAPRPPSA